MNIFEKWIRRIIVKERIEAAKKRGEVYHANTEGKERLEGKYPVPVSTTVVQRLREEVFDIRWAINKFVAIWNEQEERRTEEIRKRIKKRQAEVLTDPKVAKELGALKDAEEREKLAIEMLDEHENRTTVWLHRDANTKEKFWAELPSKPGCFASGEDSAELAEAIEEAIKLWDDDEGTSATPAVMPK